MFKSPTEKSDLETLLASMPPFENLSSKRIKILIKSIHHRVYQPNENIFMQGDPGIGLYIIEDGEVLISQKSESNQNFDLVRFGKGDFFGELALLDDTPRSASAIALKETKVGVIFRPELDEFIDKYPKSGIKVLRGISQIIATRLRRLDIDFISLYFKEIEKERENQNVQN